MLYLEIDLPSEIDGRIKMYKYDDIVDEVLNQTTYYMVQGVPVSGIVLKKDVYDFLIKQSQEQSKFWNNVKCDKIESFYGYKVAIKEVE